MSNIDLISNRQTQKRKPLIAFACDYQNVALTPDSAKLLLQFAISKGSLISKNIYYNSQCKSQSAAKNNLDSLNFTWINVPCSVKNSADNQLMVDCLKYIHSNNSPDILILVSGDGDFADLVKTLKKLEKSVIVVARFGNVKLELKELADEFYFIDDLPRTLHSKTQMQSSTINVLLSYNEALKHLTEAIKTAIEQGKSTKFSSIDKLMRQLCQQYQGCSSISTPDGKKFKKFSQFVNAAVRDGKVKIQNEELLLAI